MDLELRVERLAVGGDAIGREENGRVVFVRGALPGERVRARLTKSARDFAKADVTEILEPASSRVAPSCPYVAAGCGGCGWQHVAPASQLSLKVAMVRDALARQGRRPDAEVVAGGVVGALGYRTTLRLAAAPDGHVGLRAAASHRIVPVGTCEVAHPRLAELLGDLRVTGADEVVLRCGVATGERLAWPTGGSAPSNGPAPRLDGLADDVAVGEQAAIHEEVAGHRFRVSAPSFFQSSPEAAGLLVAAVRRAAVTEQPLRRLVDLYAGVGLFAATVAPDAEVTAVERSPSSIADARHNLAGRAATVVEADVDRWPPVPADLVVADPARSGLDRGGVATATGTGAPVIVLVSCDAAALGRDTRLLAESGYCHAGSTVLDVFPHTPHVEVVTRFERT